MDWFLLLCLVGGGSIILLLIGRQLINDYFDRKRSFVDELVKRQQED